jgi:hypothetical protein
VAFKSAEYSTTSGPDFPALGSLFANPPSIPPLSELKLA